MGKRERLIRTNRTFDCQVSNKKLGGLQHCSKNLYSVYDWCIELMFVG